MFLRKIDERIKIIFLILLILIIGAIIIIVGLIKAILEGGNMNDK